MTGPRRTDLRATTGGCPYDQGAPGRGRPLCLPLHTGQSAERIWNPDNLLAEVIQ